MSKKYKKQDIKKKNELVQEYLYIEDYHSPTAKIVEKEDEDKNRGSIIIEIF